MRGDPYEFHDPVFGVKESLVVNLDEVKDAKVAQQYGVLVGTKYLEHDFVLESNQEADELRREQATAVLGSDVKFHNDRPFLVASSNS